LSVGAFGHLLDARDGHGRLSGSAGFDLSQQPRAQSDTAAPE
jgi:hypothetical protein